MSKNGSTSSSPKELKSTGFTPQKMVDWYSPSQLAQTGLRAVISTVFGNYADKREMQSVLANSQEALNPIDFTDREELWIDYTSDLGSGFNSTYSVAYLLGREDLRVEDRSGQTHILNRGNILVMGGDEVYPTATPEEYKNRLVGPYRSSLSYVPQEEDPPTLFTIPGNHDWYDGLSSFLKLFCQQRWIGGWQTRQFRSYFAAQLPHNWWLWGLDIQLSADIDKPQIDYFDEMYRLANNGDRIILCTADPAWVYQEYQPDDKPYQNLKFFQERYTKKSEKKMTFHLTLTGDMHHYTSFKNLDSEDPDWRITAGGGGAFTHPTHQVPDILNLEEGTYKKNGAFPNDEESRRLAFKNLRFPFINTSFGVLFGIVYMFFSWFVGSADTSVATGTGAFLQYLAELGISDLGAVTGSYWSLLTGSPGLSIFLLLIFAGILGFSDTNRKKPLGSWIAGSMHGIVQILLLLTATWLTSFIIIGTLGLGLNSLVGVLLFALLVGICGWLFSGFAMGCYLLVAAWLLKTHETEAFSSFRGEDYKNFIRMHLTEKNLTIYPIKIPKACKKWVKAQKIVEGQAPWFSPKNHNEPEYGLIEDPIIIPSEKYKKE